MNEGSDGQVVRSAAKIYDEFFVPSLFEEWAPRSLETLNLGPGQRLLDVACGTGIVARKASESFPETSIIGLDPNAGMLAQAQTRTRDIEWRHGRAESLPFENETFDAVACNFGLMFFEDRVQALKEMWRVLRPGGRLAIAVWDSLDNTPGYNAMTKLLSRLFGDSIADELRAPFVLGDANRLHSLFDQAGIKNRQIKTTVGKARFPSLDDWMRVDIKGWTLADKIDDTQFETLVSEAHKDLKEFTQNDGSVSFRSPALMATASK